MDEEELLPDDQADEDLTPDDEEELLADDSVETSVPEASLYDAINAGVGSLPGVKQLGAAMNTAVDVAKHPSANIADTYDAWRAHQNAQSAKAQHDRPLTYGATSLGTNLAAAIATGPAMAASRAIGAGAEVIAPIAQRLASARAGTQIGHNLPVARQGLATLADAAASAADQGDIRQTGVNAGLGVAVGGALSGLAKGVVKKAGSLLKSGQDATDAGAQWLGESRIGKMLASDDARVSSGLSESARVKDLKAGIKASDADFGSESSAPFDRTSVSAEDSLALRLADAAREGKASLESGNRTWDPNAFGDDFRDMSTRAMRDNFPKQPKPASSDVSDVRVARKTDRANGATEHLDSGYKKPERHLKNAQYDSADEAYARYADSATGYNAAREKAGKGPELGRRSPEPDELRSGFGYIGDAETPTFDPQKLGADDIASAASAKVDALRGKLETLRAIKDGKLSKAEDIAQMQNPRLRQRELLNFKRAQEIKHNPEAAAQLEAEIAKTGRSFQDATREHARFSSDYAGQLRAEKNMTFDRANAIKGKMGEADEAAVQAANNKGERERVGKLAEKAQRDLSAIATGRSAIENVGGVAAAVAGGSRGVAGALAGAAAGKPIGKAVLKGIDLAGAAGQRLSKVASIAERLSTRDDKVGRAAKWALSAEGENAFVRMAALADMPEVREELGQ